MTVRAAYACQPQDSRGRLIHEVDAAQRSPFQRDRDRIIHSAAFRRLKHKTQVFVYHEGDHYRTRLTHSLEVAQVARSIARALGLDEDLTEALSLAHDLGHTPFGHAGERELDQCMGEHGGFNHNAQTIRIVTRLERRYAAFDGLNLCWETLEGLAKHNGPLIARNGDPLVSGVSENHVRAVQELTQAFDLDLASYAPAEAQVAAISDDIAYNAHDVDDGLRAGLFDIDDLRDIALAGEAVAEVERLWPGLERPRLIHETVRRLISTLILSVVDTTRSSVAETGVSSPEDVRQLGRPLVAFAPDVHERNASLQSFLSTHMYQHRKVATNMKRARRVVRELFHAYMDDPTQLPEGWHDGGFASAQSRQARQICDFIAGMTDRYALDEHKRLFDVDPLFR